MRIVVAAGTGFLGTPLCSALFGAGHEVIVLSRRGFDAPLVRPWLGQPSVRTFRWSGNESTVGWGHLVDAADAVVNLAGESIAAHRWTAEQKARLERSRVETTRALVEAIASAADPPAVLVNASAVGYYGSRGDERLTEASAPGDDFLARLVVRWEADAQQAASARTRVALLRTGVVLERDGGALSKMLPPFRLGLGGPVGSGRQYMAWIHREDWVALLEWILERDVDGAFNLTAPEPVTSAAFARALGAALHRPAVLPAPAFALRLAMGEMADALLLSSQRAVPERALSLGFSFRYPTIEAALRAIVGS